MPQKYGPRKPEFYNYYSVYNRKADEPVYIHGTARQCSKAMKVKESTFYHYINRNRTGRQRCKYEIFEEGRAADENG